MLTWEWLLISAVIALLWLWLGIGGIILTGRPKYERFVNSNERSRDWLLQALRGAKDEVVIVSGNLNPRVYDSTLAATVREKLTNNQKIKIRILSGPTIFTLGGRNEIAELAKEQARFGESLMIQFLTHRPIYHFRTVDATHLYVEDPHDPGQSHRMVSVLKNSYFKGWQYRRAFERVWQEEERADSSRLQFVSIDNNGEST